ncbi:hypothetical protein GCM10011613_19650 [Cellvibrio zantedeschiae]|uniref:Uncharacterized protein n=1 Tax=Cellvibrio zantedeschiae TaxID=1237077 RepID=A0ABQ3B293_9GAMM|nr:hypothetical protein [Cellvibrio zantedeschiae]GGY74331.1 hypothetical protein GCM10011613_19650 [Cellvibrio zantedeschiae]
MQIQKLTDKQKIFAIAVLVVVACASMLLVQVPQSEKGAHMWTAESIPVPQTVNSSPTMKAEMPTVVPAQSVQKFSPQSATAVAVNADVKSWTMGDVKTDTPKIPLSEKISDYAIVQLEQNPEQLPAVGQQIQLPMLNGQSVVANVESTTTNPNGDYTWSGHLQGYGTDYPVVMTYGEHSIFATITTPQGSFTMESIDGLGWLYKNPAEIELSNPGANDFLEVNEPH